MKFSDVEPPLCKEIINGINTLGFSQMTPVQASTIPLFLTNKDVAVDACTGSGKTLAFVLPLIQKLYNKYKDIAVKTSFNQLFGLIISPTRELSRQIYETALFFFKQVFSDSKETLGVCLFVGGTSVENDLENIKKYKNGKSIFIGTPGRLEDVIKRSHNIILDTSEFEMLILDEADTLLDLGFEVCINNILKYLPKQRRTGIFSATQTNEFKALSRAGLRNPFTISVKVKSNDDKKNNIQKTPSTLMNYYKILEPREKMGYLINFIMKFKDSKIIIFFSTCCSVDFFNNILKEISLISKEFNYNSECIIPLHGKMNQKKRTAHYEKYTNLKQGILICTDVVARGLDMPDVNWIIQYDAPQDPNFFVHRVGRTARAGKYGNALMFLTQKEDTYINFLRLRKIPVDNIDEIQIANKENTDIINDNQSKNVIKIDSVVESENIISLMKKLVSEDRDLLEKGTRAFISYLRSYKEHQCQFIFRFRDLDMINVAHSFALLQLPKINEFRKLNHLKYDEKPKDLKIINIKYKDKNREKQRQIELERIQKEKENKTNINQVKSHPEKRNNVGYMGDKKINNNEQCPRRREKKKGRNQQIIEEWEELANEETLFKKLKRGKISKEEYENVINGHEIDCNNTNENDMNNEEIKIKKIKIMHNKKFEKKDKAKQITTQEREARKLREQRIRSRKKKAHLLIKSRKKKI